MGAVISVMLATLIVAGGVLGAAAWLHHLAGSTESQARLRRWRMQVQWHERGVRSRTTRWARLIRRLVAAGLS